LLPYKNFDDWCEDRDTARAAELLYGHIDNLELYPGLMAECTKPAIPGSGVCPGQTTGRGILDDAVSLVRGDRFLSYDLNSNTLTNYGLGKLGSASGGSYGGVLNHLLFNGLPYSFTGTSPYVLLPFYTPEAVRGILKGNNSIENYDLERPPNDGKIATILTYDGCKKILEDRENFRVMYRDPMREVTNGKDTMISWDEQKKHDDRRAALEKAFFEEGFEEHVSKFFRETVAKLIKESSLKYPGSRRSIDIVRDVTNVAPILWLAHKFAIPLKTLEHPDGLLSIPETFDALLAVHEYTSFDALPAWQWNLRDAARKGGKAMREIFEAHLKTQQGHGIKEGIVDWLAQGSAFEVGPEADRLYHALNDSKRPIDELVADCIGIAAPAAGNLTQQASLLVDLFLTKGYEEHYKRIVELAQKDDASSQKELEGYVLEGMRFAAFLPGILRVSAGNITFTDGEQGPVDIKAHQTVLVATAKANMDPAAFPDPKKLDPHRPRDTYLTMGFGMHACFGRRLAVTGLTAMIKEIFKLKGLKRANGKLGQFTTVEQDIGSVKKRLWLDANARESTVPTTLTLEYSEQGDGQKGNSTAW
jgi:cytochrome P450